MSSGVLMGIPIILRKPVLMTLSRFFLSLSEPVFCVCKPRLSPSCSVRTHRRHHASCSWPNTYSLNRKKWEKKIKVASAPRQAPVIYFKDLALRVSLFATRPTHHYSGVVLYSHWAPQGGNNKSHPTAKFTHGFNFFPTLLTERSSKLHCFPLF